jgi:hypothetical protein
MEEWRYSIFKTMWHSLHVLNTFWTELNLLQDMVGVWMEFGLLERPKTEKPGTDISRVKHCQRRLRQSSTCMFARTASTPLSWKNSDVEDVGNRWLRYHWYLRRNDGSLKKWLMSTPGANGMPAGEWIEMARKTCVLEIQLPLFRSHWTRSCCGECQATKQLVRQTCLGGVIQFLEMNAGDPVQCGKSNAINQPQWFTINGSHKLVKSPSKAVGFLGIPHWCVATDFLCTSCGGTCARFYWFPRAQIPGGDVFSDASAANFLHRTLVEAKLMSKKDAKQDTVGL